MKTSRNTGRQISNTLQPQAQHAAHRRFQPEDPKKTRSVCYSNLMSARGGVATAAGLGFQYLATLKDALDLMIATGDSEIVLQSEDPDNEVVDYSFSRRSGETVLAVQAKASVDGPHGPAMGLTEAVAILKRLVINESVEYAIRTNRRLTKSCARLKTILASYRNTPDCSRRIKKELSELLPSPLYEELSNLNQRELERLSRATIDSTPIDSAQLTDELKARTRNIRRASGIGIGVHSSAVLVGYLTSKLMELSSRRQNRSLTSREFRDILRIDPPVLHGAAATVDWGVPIGPVPKTQSVIRITELDKITGFLNHPPKNASTRKMVITGLSGIGKSTLASNALMSIRHFYDRILWIDSNNDESIRNSACQYLGLDAEATGEEVFEAFKNLISSSPATWLVVFDNASDARTLQSWTPNVGAVDIVATSTNSIGWGPSWKTLPLTTMSDSESIEMIKDRLGYEELTSDQRKTALSLCHELDNWPLALELACAFLAENGRGLDMTQRYLELLRQQIIDDDSLVPAEYQTHKPLLQAILVAFDAIESYPPEPNSILPTTLLGALCYLPARAAPLRAAGRIAFQVEAQLGRTSIIDSDASIDGTKLAIAIDSALRKLSHSSLVQRQHSLETNPNDIALANEIALDVFRQFQDINERELFLINFQRFFNQNALDALSEYQFKDIRGLLPSILTTTRHALDYELLTMEGLTLLGNIASLYAQLHYASEALYLYNLELSILQQSSLEAPLLYSKVYASSVGLMLNLNAKVDEIVHATDSCLYHLAQCLSDPNTHSEAHQPASQIYHHINNMKRLELQLNRPQLEHWEQFIMAEYPSLKPGPAYDRLQAQLAQVGNEDNDTLHSIDDELARDLTPPDRQPLLFLRADALASLKRFEESLRAFRHAISVSSESGLGLSTGWTSILNAWRTAGLSALGVGDNEPYSFCKQLESLVGNEEPSDPDDLDSLRICKLMSHVFDGPIAALSAQVEICAGFEIHPSIMRPHPETDSEVVEVCRKVLTIRTRADGAILGSMASWARVTLPEAEKETNAIAVGAESFIADLITSNSLTGHWLETDEGIGLLVHMKPSLLILTPCSGTGWLSYDGNPGQNEAQNRLLNIHRSNAYDHYFENTIVGYFSSNMPGGVIDPTKRAVNIKTEKYLP